MTELSDLHWARLLIKFQKCTIYHHGAINEYSKSPGEIANVIFTAQWHFKGAYNW